MGFEKTRSLLYRIIILVLIFFSNHKFQSFQFMQQKPAILVNPNQCIHDKLKKIINQPKSLFSIHNNWQNI